MLIEATSNPHPCRFVIEGVKPEDYLGLTLYNDTVSTPFPPQPMKARAKAAAMTVVERMVADGGTALYAALEEGIKQVQSAIVLHARCGINRAVTIGTTSMTVVHKTCFFTAFLSRCSRLPAYAYHCAFSKKDTEEELPLSCDPPQRCSGVSRPRQPALDAYVPAAAFHQSVS